ncbi:MAG: hypothetical protein K0U45_08660 [Alphaproteobacteria bacterium]|nr:hypothetical protein [Alphaproteobacteria bacterium]
MKNDLYMKVIMTVIAISLAKIALVDSNLIKPVVAASGVQKVTICNTSGTGCVSTRGGVLSVRDN